MTYTAVQTIHIDKLSQAKFDELETHVRAMGLSENSMSEAVLAFMVAFDQHPRNKHDQVTKAEFDLAYRLVFSEEHGEVTEMLHAFHKFAKAQSFENLTEFVDGAIDSIYVILWTLLKFNVPVQACFDEVQRSNMAKLQADGTYIKKEGKVVKPPGWTPPDLHSIIVQHFDRSRK